MTIPDPAERSATTEASTDDIADHIDELIGHFQVVMNVRAKPTSTFAPVVIETTDRGLSGRSTEKLRANGYEIKSTAYTDSLGLKHFVVESGGDDVDT